MREIPPGGEGKITVSPSTRNRRGKLAKTVTVESNDPKQPRFQLKIHGEVRVLADFELSYLNLNNVLKNSNEKRLVKLVGEKVSDLEIKELISSAPETLLVKATKAEGGEPAVEVTFKAGAEKQHFQGMITAKTNLEKPDQLTLRVRANVTDDISALPAQLYFTQFAQEKLQRPRVVRIRSLSEQPFKINKVEDPKGAVKAEFRKVGDMWQLEANLVGNPDPPEGKLLVYTDSKKQPVVEVPYRVRMLRKATPRRVDRTKPDSPSGERPRLPMVRGKPGRLPLKIAPKKPRVRPPT
ncbi:MAG: DUF1573 domain-containing protein [Deltaproteobacteria bacterium]|nr:DUF1573 domain-containing protein [Deltaproteobacteria bacterium]